MISADPFQPEPTTAVGNRPPEIYGRLETLTLIHVGAMVVFGAWAFGGNAAWSRLALTILGCLGVVLTIAGLRRTTRDPRPGLPSPYLWLWPLLALNALVIASLFNPSFRQVTNGVTFFYTQTEPPFSFLPSSARPDRSLAALLFFNGIYLSSFNLVLFVRHRSAFRRLLMILAANALLLAIFGTLQKLVGSKGLFFGLTGSPQKYFFASFIYHNHWGAFTVLMVAVMLGLVFHFARRPSGRDLWHSPAAAGIVAVLFLAASVPLSASRSCTILVLALLAGALLHGVFELAHRRRSDGRPILWTVTGGTLALVAAILFVYEIAQPVIAARMDDTTSQVAEMTAHGSFGSRAVLYRDTWRMVVERPWFGWGLNTYPTVFNLYNTQLWAAPDGLPMYFDDAHSDWLQSLAELGFAGTALLGLCAAIPLYRRRQVVFRSPVSVYLITGCAFLLLYAWLEFPFGNSVVALMFWVGFFTAIHYGRIEGSPRRTG